MTFYIRPFWESDDIQMLTEFLLFFLFPSERDATFSEIIKRKTFGDE